MLNEQQFLNDVASHEMQVIRDEGVHRHVRFKKPGTMCMHFDLITWPGYLCYTGDMGTYVFRRLEDMFEFFRVDRMYLKEHMRRRNETLAINRSYWAEKIEAQDRCDGVTEFSEEKFNRAVMEDLVYWIRNNANRTSKDERRELWDAVMSEVIGADGDNGGYRKQCAAHDFHHRVNDRRAFYFQDFLEHNVEEYTHRFMWCCYALAWGIQKYDEAKQAGSTAVASFPCGSMGEEVAA